MPLFFNRQHHFRHNILPIVMGARPSDYAQNAPHKSYIHVDDFSSAQELAAYLHKLDQNDDLYNEYFQWKGTGEMINTKFFCRLCAVLHSEQVSWPFLFQMTTKHRTLFLLPIRKNTKFYIIVGFLCSTIHFEGNSRLVQVVTSVGFCNL